MCFSPPSLLSIIVACIAIFKLITPPPFPNAASEREAPPMSPVDVPCINTESASTLDRLEKPALQLPPGYCYDRKDHMTLRWMARNKRTPYTNMPLTSNATQCVVQWASTGDVSSRECKMAGGRLVT